MAAKDTSETQITAELEDARDMLYLAAAVLERWQLRLESVARGLPGAQFAEETDDPLNLSAAWRGLLEATLQDELRPAIATLRRAAEWSDDPASWRKT